MKLTSAQLRRIIVEEVRSLREAQQSESEHHWNSYMQYSSLPEIAEKLPGLHDSFISVYEERASRGDVRSDAIVDILLQAIAENL